MGSYTKAKAHVRPRENQKVGKPLFRNVLYPDTFPKPCFFRSADKQSKRPKIPADGRASIKKSPPVGHAQPCLSNDSERSKCSLKSGREAFVAPLSRRQGETEDCGNFQ